VGAAKGAEAKVTKLVHQHFRDVKLLGAHEGGLSFEVAQGFAFAKVFAAFEHAKREEHTLETFTMSQTTLEDVFLRVAEQYKDGVKIQARALQAAAPVPQSMTAEGEPEAAAASAVVQDGLYVNKCCNVWMKVTPDPPLPVGETAPPSYKTQCQCFMYSWVVPIPCCCCEQHMVMVPDDVERNHNEQNAEVYETATARPFAIKERHVWKESGEYVATGTMGTDTYTLKWAPKPKATP